ncbi:hypothetical protein FRC17_003919 [Serendipita sp. 399]|nr:hypothetical protein FRC17_003919 [Serendipita sp. 399]
MKTPLHASLDSVQTEGENRINEFIVTMQQHVKNYEATITKEEELLNQSEKAIQSLEKGLAFAKNTLESQQQNLLALIAVQTHISTKESSSDWRSSDEEIGGRLCQLIEATLAEQTKDGASMIGALVKLFRDKRNKIIQTTQRLEAELTSWHLSRNLYNRSLDRSRGILQGINSDLAVARRVYWRVPIEIWIWVFRLRARGDIDEFYTVQNERPFQPTAAILSQVCRLWHKIVMQEPDLWCHIAAHPCEQWPNGKLELFRSSLEKAKGRRILICNVSQTAIWAKGQNYYDQILRAHQYPTTVSTEILEGDYDVVLVAGNDYSSYMTRIPTFPFKGPEKLTLVNRPGSRQGHFFTYIPHYATVKSLEVVDPTPYSFDTLQISSRFPNLIELSLEAERFIYQFDSQSFPTTLKSLRIRHSGQENLPAVSGVASLPNLTILDVTPPATSLFQTINTPFLHQLLLQGPSRTATVAPYPPHNSRIFLQRVKHFEFYNWLNPNHITRFVNCDAVSTLREWISQMPKVTRLKFVDSHVDGASLIEAVRSWNDSGTPKVRELTLDRCTGITRQECEDLLELVEKVKVFV